jgi:hypothetical protein
MKYIKRYNTFSDFENNELVEDNKGYTTSELPCVAGIRTNTELSFYNKDYDPQDIVIDED